MTIHDTTHTLLSTSLEKLQHIDDVVRTLPLESPLRDLLITITPILYADIKFALHNTTSEFKLMQILELTGKAQTLISIHSNSSHAIVEITPAQLKAWLDLSSELVREKTTHAEAEAVLFTKINMLDAMIRHIQDDIPTPIMQNLMDIQALVSRYYATPHTSKKLQTLDHTLNSILVYLESFSKPTAQRAALVALQDVKSALESMHASQETIVGEEAKCLQSLKESIAAQENMTHHISDESHSLGA